MDAKNEQVVEPQLLSAYGLWGMAVPAAVGLGLAAVNVTVRSRESA